MGLGRDSLIVQGGWCGDMVTIKISYKTKLLHDAGIILIIPAQFKNCVISTAR